MIGVPGSAGLKHKQLSAYLVQVQGDFGFRLGVLASDLSSGPRPLGKGGQGYQSDANFGEPEDGKNTEKMKNRKDQVWSSMDQGSGCGSVGRAVSFDTRDPQFKSRQLQNFIYPLYSSKRGREWPIFKKSPRDQTMSWPKVFSNLI